MFQCVQAQADIGSYPNMKGPRGELRMGMEAQLAVLDDRLKVQEQEVGDVMDLLRKRAEIEKRYSKELEALSKQMRGKHKDLLSSPSSGSSVSHILRQFILETGDLARDHGAMDEVLSTEMTGICQNILTDVQSQHKQCKQAGQDIQANVLRTLYELQNNNKVLQKCKSNHEVAEKKLLDVNREIQKLEKDNPKPEKREKNKKYQEKKKLQVNKLNRMEDTLNQAMQAQLEQVLSLEAANESVSKNYRIEVAELMDCMDLSYHHHMKHLVEAYTAAQQVVASTSEQHLLSLHSACSNLNARSDKQQFLQTQPAFAVEPELFKAEINRQFQSLPEDMTTLKQKVSEKIEHLRGISKDLEQELEIQESNLLQTFKTTNCDINKYFGTRTDVRRTDLPNVQIEKIENFHRKKMDSQHLQDNIIEKCKNLIIINNKIIQEEAKYNYLKKILIVQNYNPDTLPRPNLTKRRMRTQTAGLPTLFGGSLDEYYEATGEKIPLVVESCIKYINNYGMKHQGIFRIGGAHVDINRFEEEFEKGSDPFSMLVNGNHINSVCGVLGRYFRKLSEALFGEAYFDQLMNVIRNHPPPHVNTVKEKSDKSIASDVDFVVKTQIIVKTWTEPHIIVTRYFFSFLHDLSQYSEATQMDAHNLAVCFGPTLCPIPVGKDLVQFTTLVNELIKNFIIFCHDIFNFDIDGPEYKPRQLGDLDEEEEDEAQDEGDNAVEVEREGEEKPSTKLKAIAEHDFESDNPKVLNFKANDPLILYSQASADWWKGSNGEANGLIPSKYIRVLEEQKPEVVERQLGDNEGDSVETKHLSFNSSKKMWESLSPGGTNERKKSSKDQAPDLLQDVLDKSQEIEVTVVGAMKKKKDSVIVGTAV